MALIKKVGKMPYVPEARYGRDWKQTALGYDALVFDYGRKGDFMPLIWRDETGSNGVKETFGLYSYLGSYRQSESVWSHEAINCVAAVLGASIAGVDKQGGEHDFVDMLRCYFNTDNGENMFLNTPKTQTGGSFWYEIYPCVLLARLIELYENGPLTEAFVSTAKRWYACCESIKAAEGRLNFGYTAFNFREMKPKYNGVWREPDAAAGIAYILFKLYKMTGEEKYLAMSKECVSYLSALGEDENPLYEVLMPYGAYTAARLNAEYGCGFDVVKLVNFCFEGNSAVRAGWGCIAGKWGEHRVDGLIGSNLDANERWDQTKRFFFKKPGKHSGYAFAGNTFMFVGALLPLVRYDRRFAEDIGRWLLNVSENANLFYKTALDKKHQSCAFFRGDEKDVIAYEGLKKYWDGMSPYATGDAIRYSWGSIDLGLYGSSFVGFLGGSIHETDVREIKCWDLSATDICGKGRAYLLYNPLQAEAKVTFELPCEHLVTDAGAALQKADGKFRAVIPARSAIVAEER